MSKAIGLGIAPKFLRNPTGPPTPPPPSYGPCPQLTRYNWGMSQIAVDDTIYFQIGSYAGFVGSAGVIALGAATVNNTGCSTTQFVVRINGTLHYDIVTSGLYSGGIQYRVDGIVLGIRWWSPGGVRLIDNYIFNNYDVIVPVNYNDIRNDKGHADIYMTGLRSDSVGANFTGTLEYARDGYFVE